MALQISPILSTPHFILLHAGCFTARQRRWLKATGKVVSLLSQRIIKQTPERSVRKSLFPQSHWTCITQNAACCRLQWEWSEIEAYLTSSALISSEGLMVIWHLCGPTGDVGAQLECVGLLVCAPVIEHLIAAVMYPHYAPVPWPSHPAYRSSWGTGESGLPLLSAPPSPCPSDSKPPSPNLQPCWVVLLWFGDFN